jgi:hypothetical protein
LIGEQTDVSADDIARWLAELAQVLEGAQELVNSLALARGHYIETLDVSARLEAARAEVRSLRHSRMDATIKDLGPCWSEHLPWDRALLEHRV